MSQLSNEKIYQEVGNIVANFELYKCDECANAVMQWLRENGISGRIIKIQTRLGEDYIISKRLERLLITDSITLNGIHYGVEVQERVFDNLSTEGLTLSNWLNDFECPSGEFIVDYLNEI
ncbi:MAG: papain fold toxin domain-containing protein [Aulosira sp. ZfuVER01]|nr:papain fold toxin domain-containing protein [Aulosira sp. ZfuVER01]MDZ7997215.1 papain fold toxin domain-containing protein [Aulosira sp. DedVER01a]MDZ8056010.1 papain fold toxin domain-containing protein [Aulosira sp. ZfuCHP01]